MNISELVNNQRDFFQSGHTRPLSQRLAVLEKLGITIENQEANILKALKSDLGKPTIEAYLSEVYFLKQELRFVQKKLKKWAQPTKVPSPFYHFPERAEIHLEPYGSTLIISPWNYPIQISLAPLISAIAAGNTAILKPSELAPATSDILSQIVDSVFPTEHATVIEGGADTSQSLLKERFDLIFFTGSERVGRIVAEAAAKHLTPTVLELGGKCPVLVDSTADASISADRIVRGKFFNAGQTCLAADYVVAHESIYQDLIDAITKRTKALYQENPDVKDDFATIVNDTQYQRLTNLIVPADSKLISFGEDHPDELRLSPKLIPDAQWQDNAMQEEIFGPILPVLKYSDESNLISNVNQHPNPLGLYLFSKDQDWIDRMLAAIPSGSVGINDILKQGINLNLPLGGIGQSGMGNYRGYFGFQTFSHQRSVSHRKFAKDLFSIDPPYAGKFEKNRKFLK